VISDEQLQLLELYLDGELPPEEARALEARMAAQPELAEAMRQLRSERKLREGYFGALEPQEVAVIEIAGRALAHAHQVVAMRRARRRWLAATSMRVFGYASAAAALLVIGLLLGRLAHQNVPPTSHANGGPTQPAMTAVYNVSITDESGKVVGVQKFKSLDEAQRFSEDLQNWQDRQEQLRNGQVTLRSAKF